MLLTQGKQVRTAVHDFENFHGDEIKQKGTKIDFDRVGHWTKFLLVAGRVGVLKYTIGYLRVSLLFSCISGYFGYFRVFLGI